MFFKWKKKKKKIVERVNVYSLVGTININTEICWVYSTIHICLSLKNNTVFNEMNKINPKAFLRESQVENMNEVAVWFSIRRF